MSNNLLGNNNGVLIQYSCQKKITSYIIEIFQNFSEYFDYADQQNQKKREAKKLICKNGFTKSGGIILESGYTEKHKL